MRYLPIFLDLNHSKVIIAGGGEVALSKLKTLLKTQADLHVYASKIDPQIEDLAAIGRVQLTRRKLTADDAKGAAVIYATYYGAQLNAQIRDMGHAAGALVNVVDDPAQCDFISPAIVDRDPVVVAIGTEGAAPVLARQIKARLEETLPPQLGLMARVAKGFRTAVTALPFGRARRDFWSEYYSHSVASETDASRLLHDLLSRHQSAALPAGDVALVGAGPGAADLLTLAARNALDKADLVIHDAGIAPEILDLARREATSLPVHDQQMPPVDFTTLMIREAKSGARVVRLFAQNPPMDHLAQTLLRHGITYRVIPGVCADAKPRQSALFQRVPLTPNISQLRHAQTV